MKWYQSPRRISVLFLSATIAVHCSLGWRIYNSFHIIDSMWPFISVGSLYNRYETIVLMISIFLCIIISIKQIRISGFKTEWTNLVISLLLTCVMIIIGHAVVIRILTNVLNTNPIDDKEIIELEKIIQDSTYSVSERSKMSEIISSWKFTEKGKITQYIDKDGITREYNPTAEDKNIRNGQLRLKEKIIPSFKRYMFFWSIILLIPIIIGLIVPIKRNLHNQTLNADG